VLFNAGCNKQMFSPNSEKTKKMAQIGLVVFEKNAKNTHFNSEKYATEPKAKR